MKRATENLEKDHENILRLTNILLAMVEKKSVEAAHFEQAVKVIKNYADGLHHRKEEELLFPILKLKGFSPDQGPVAVMLHEHEAGREYVRRISKGIEELRKGNLQIVDHIYENLEGYAYLLQGHISKENNVLFRMADQVLSNDEQGHLLKQFQKIDESRESEYTVELAISTIDVLETIYL